MDGRGTECCIASEHEPEQLHAKILSIWRCMKRRPRKRDGQVLKMVYEYKDVQVHRKIHEY